MTQFTVATCTNAINIRTQYICYSINKAHPCAKSQRSTSRSIQIQNTISATHYAHDECQHATSISFHHPSPPIREVSEKNIARNTNTKLAPRVTHHAKRKAAKPPPACSKIKHPLHASLHHRLELGAGLLPAALPAAAAKVLSELLHSALAADSADIR